MIIFPNAKINLGLRILHKRKDGYHALQTLFVPVRGLTDALEIIRNPDTAAPDDVVFTSGGLPIAGAAEHNLCVKAYRLLKQDFPDLPRISMHLHKIIPMGAGLGGGSSDGAATLLLLNDKFQLQLSQDQLLHYALQLGSDCPFFILNEPCFATGRGEHLSPVAFQSDRFKMIIVHPGIHVSTAEAFNALGRSEHDTFSGESLSHIIRKPVHEWKDLLINDFQQPVVQRHPEIGSIIEQLYQQGALYASLSGSGSAVYGLFEKSARPACAFPPSFFIKVID